MASIEQRLSALEVELQSLLDQIATSLTVVGRRFPSRSEGFTMRDFNRVALNSSELQGLYNEASQCSLPPSGMQHSRGIGSIFPSLYS